MTADHPKPAASNEKPSDKVASGRGTAADLALMDQARAEARDDLARLRAAYAGKASSRDESAALTWLVQGMLDGPSWGRLELVTVLGEALAELARRDAALADLDEAQAELNDRDEWAASLARALEVPEDLNPFFGIDRMAREQARLLRDADAALADLTRQRDEAVARLQAQLTLQAEIDSLQRSADSWRESARIYAINADEWRAKAERQAPVIEAATRYEFAWDQYANFTKHPGINEGQRIATKAKAHQELLDVVRALGPVDPEATDGAH